MSKVTDKTYITHTFQDFQEGVRILMLIDRGVMNANKGSRRWINKIITTSKKEWEGAVDCLLELQYHLGNPDIRLYASVNDRKLDKAINYFKHAQLDVQDDQKVRFYSKINNTFCSALMKPENKNSKLFLLDIDSHDTKEVDKFISDNSPLRVVLTYRTVNGWHYVCEPFNASLANGFKTFKLIKDGLLLLNWIG